MEIAVAAQSPLGQYLAELDAEGGASMAQLRSVPCPKKRSRRSDPMWKTWSRGQLIQRLRRQVELVAVRRAIPELVSFHSTIKEELQMTGSAAAVDTVLSKPHESWWVIGELFREVKVVGEVWTVLAVVGGASIAAVAAESEVETILAVTVLVLLSLELSVRILLTMYEIRSRRLVSSLNDFVAALAKFNEVYTRSLTLIKRAELASRGYRLGACLLPPIGRLEAADIGGADDNGDNDAVSTTKIKLRCLPLRTKLRLLNDQLQAQASTLIHKEMKAIHEVRDAAEEDFVNERAPSLLLTVLAKQRNHSVLVLENAMRTVLVRTLAGACSARNSPFSCSLFPLLSSRQVAVKQLVGELNSWSDDLDVWNTTSDSMTLRISASGMDSSNKMQQDQQTSSSACHSSLKSVTKQLQDLRSTSETLTALIIAAQHELLSGPSTEELHSSGDAMRSMVGQLHDAWSNFDTSLSDVTAGENTSQNIDEITVDKEGDHETRPFSISDISTVPVPEDPNCTVIFTGTSIGDDGFDLKKLLKQQEATTVSSGPTPHFVHELRDVLAHREAHAYPGLTKQVDHDPPAQLTTVTNVGLIAPLPPPAADAMFALPDISPRPRPRRPSTSAPIPTDIATSDGISLSMDSVISSSVPNPINLEFLALLQQKQSSQKQDVMEYLLESDEKSEIDEPAQVDPKLKV
ncbi:hypothetical protein PHMEG_00017144 [Phytophthora megakarya]|uniref:Myosin-binding domain-containing protein n=1 Tax=Phytophthora megakarya TaxID=4795 RepID=A0A225VWZ9_9STRA|nr:hypothetical protein PHMEG_00017144 [Phytophthora megakarya]